MLNYLVYHIHTSPGFVISSKPYREADRVYQIFTKEFGLISAIAQGIRLEKSKLRYSISDLSITNLSLVHGKEFWRIVGADNVDSIKNSDKVIIILAKLANLIKRLVHGEEKNEKIFDLLLQLTIIDIKDRDIAENIESLSVLRVLHELGYIAMTREIQTCIEDDIALIGEALDQDKRKFINQLVNNALKQTQL